MNFFCNYGAEKHEEKKDYDEPWVRRGCWYEKHKDGYQCDTECWHYSVSQVWQSSSSSMHSEGDVLIRF